MIRDLRTILDGWDYEPGKISVRKIIGKDGREKIQTRIDLGVLQLEATGRPDGKRPFGSESLLEHHLQRLQQHRARYGDDDRFVLTPEECRELRHEAYLYYQRYLSQFVLEEFDAVTSDTQRNLRVIDLCEQYAANDYDRRALSNQRAYVSMMYCRASVYGALQERAFDDALARVDEGIRDLVELVEAALGDEEAPCDTELTVLRQLRREVIQRMPADAMPRLEWELQAAVRDEDYERAARIRDQIATRSSVSARPA